MSEVDKCFEIAKSNYWTGFDQDELGAYLVNAIDTAREQKLSAEDTARAFLRLFEAGVKVRADMDRHSDELRVRR